MRQALPRRRLLPPVPHLTQENRVAAAVGVDVVLCHTPPGAKLKAPPVAAAAVEARVALENLLLDVDVRLLGTVRLR